MKILIPIKEKNQNASIAEAFGRAPYFAVYNTKNNTTTFLHNQNTNRAGGVGITTGQLAIDNNVDQVVAVNIGPKARRVLESANIDIKSVDQNTNLKDIINEQN